MSAKLVGIVDYGIGNHGSVRSAFRKLGCDSQISNDIDFLNSCDALVLPGVGSFGTAMAAIEHRNMRPWLAEKAAHGTPMLGICLGMQLLLEKSYEDGVHKGLDIIPGEVVPFDIGTRHIGWNDVNSVSPLNSQHNLVGACYFNHSYWCDVPDSIRTMSTVYRREFTAAFQVGNIFGYQFHPEKSQSIGKLLMRHFLGESLNG
jgi:glutamine amidotransferase